MKRNIIILSLAFVFLLIGSVSSISAQVKCAVLPFKNAAGNVDMNIWSYKLQDSLTTELSALDPDNKKYEFVSIDDIEDELAQLNLDPGNPQYETDMWKALANLGVDKVVMGDFNFKGNRFLINAYVVDIKTKLRDQNHQARNIFKKEKDIMSAVGIIVKKLKKLFI